MNKIIESAGGEIATGALHWFLVMFLGKHYVTFLTRQLVLKGVAEAEAKKQLKQFVDDPNPMAAFIQAENETEYKNMFKTLVKALPKIKKGSPKMDEVDFDVMQRLKDVSKTFSSEDMQEVVAGILAGEYNQPGTFSIKTLEVVRSLGKKDIELFQKFCGYVFNGKNFFTDGYNLNSDKLSILEEQGIGYDNFLYLQDLELVGGRTFGQNCGEQGNNEEIYAYPFSIQNYNTLFIRKGFTVINGLGNLTKAGEELLTVTGCIDNGVLKKLVIDHFNQLGFKENEGI